MRRDDAKLLRALERPKKLTQRLAIDCIPPIGWQRVQLERDLRDEKIRPQRGANLRRSDYSSIELIASDLEAECSITELGARTNDD